jgi:hypothetical protein
VASAFCKLQAQCDTWDMQASFGGSMSVCVARTELACPNVSETGTSNTPSSVESCATALSQIVDCTTFAKYVLAHDGALCSTLPGTRPDGAPCADDSQCKGGLCGPASEDAGLEGGASSGCGACAEKPASPGCNLNADCPTGQLCNANATCVVAGAPGASCDDSNPYQAVQPCQAGAYCAFDLSASLDAGALTGTCTLLADVGKPCNPNDDVNDCADGLFCTTQGACAQIQFVAVGGACDERGLVCAGSGCVFTSADGNADGLCSSYVSDGSACRTDSDCEFNSFCPNGTCVAGGPVCN